MKRLTTILALALAFAAAPLSAGRLPDDALALVPPDAATVGVVRFADLRTSPLFDRLFAGMDRISVDGDAARFLDETRLDLRQDVDLVVAAGSPKAAGGDSTGLVIVEGRFDPIRLTAALVSRGAEARSSANGAYLLLADKKHPGHDPGAAAFVGSHLVVAGSEPAVLAALAARAAGGSGFASGTGLGQHLGRIEPGAAAWALVDVTRVPTAERRAHAHAAQPSEEAPRALMAAMRGVSLVAFQVSPNGDALKLSATGLSADEETRALLEDAVRGVLAAWRLAAQDKSPETVSLLRKFKVTRDGDGVSLSGTLSGDAVRALSERKAAAK